MTCAEARISRDGAQYPHKEWFVGELIDTNGLYDALHDYTRKGGARDWILKGRRSESFFVTSSDNPELDARKLYAKVSASTLFVLSKIDDTRWSGVRSYGAHAERKIVFNSVAEPVSSPNFHASFYKACGKLLITPEVANAHYRFAAPEEYAAGVVSDLDRERRARVPSSKKKR